MSTPTIDELGPPDEDTMRILVSTDNHLGYMERDPARGLDSFAALEEVLYLAKKYKSDMVLLAGDLFHDNKPTRRTLHKTMEILKRYTMGPDPVQIQILSEGNFAHGEANYLQEFFSVDLPVFSIHGNHDDPTRDGTELLAALDLLSVSSLVNYFGRQDAVDKVEISPILLKKGDTQVALYGMGSLRDERLNRMWQSKKVRFQRPGEGDWFNIFALHQNRDLGRGRKNCVHETMIPEWMDLVVWGHEHECLIEPSESVVGTFRISQPGSSVATSLTAGESIRKHVGFLDIRNNQFRLTPCPLTQVRSFLMGEVSLNGQGFEPDDPKIDEKVTSFLEGEIKLLMHNAKEKRKELLIDSKEQGNDPDEQEDLVYQLRQPDQHLVRLKVEHSGFTVLNNQRFGARFVGQVANPSDLLLFHRRKETGDRSGVKRKKKLDKPIVPEEQDVMKIEDLIKDNLEISDKKLEVLDEAKLTIALEEFVDKEIKQAMSEATNKMLTKQQKKLLSREADEKDDDEEGHEEEDEEGEDEEEEETPKPKRGRTSSKRKPAYDEDEEEESPPPRKGRKKAAAKAPPRKRTAKRKASVSEEDDDDDSVEAPSPPKSRARPKRQNRAKTVYVDDDDDDDDDEVLDDEEEVAVVKPKKRTARSTARVSRRKRASQDSDEEFGNSYGVDDDWAEANTNSA